MIKKIMICEDDRDILELLEIILKSKYSTTSYSRIHDIVKMVEQAKPDLILMDLWIPEMGGARSVEILRQNPLYKNIPVILVSASDKLEKIAVELGVNAFIQKPFDIFYCLQTIESVLQDVPQHS